MTELVTMKEVLEIRQSLTKNGLFDLHAFANEVAKRQVDKLAPARTFNISLDGIPKADMSKIEAAASIEEIGRINMGTDVYMLLRTEEPVALPVLKAQLNDKYRYESRNPGAIFCSGVSVMAKPYYDCEYVVIIHNRYDC